MDSSTYGQTILRSPGRGRVWNSFSTFYIFALLRSAASLFLLNILNTFIFCTFFEYHIYEIYYLTLQISWIRLRDWHILTNGVQTYTSDHRFQVLHKEGSYDWVLQIRFVQERDAGTYECQV